MKRIRDWIDNIVEELLRNSGNIRIFFIPAVLFVLDLTIRYSLKLDLADGGADMALLGVSIFVGLLLDSEDRGQSLVFMLFALVFTVMWIICLNIISLDPIPFPQPQSALDLRSSASWLVGLLTFIFSTLLGEVLIRKRVSNV